MGEYTVGDGKRALVRRNRAKIDRRGSNIVHDPGEGVISYFVSLDFKILNSVE